MGVFGLCAAARQSCVSGSAVAMVTHSPIFGPARVGFLAVP